MKPADRALDLAVVGLGQGGGNLAAEFARLGYRAIALNTAHTDLSSLAPGQRSSSLSADQRVYIGIDGYDGAGADLNYGRECIAESADRIRQIVSNHAEGADVVVLTAGLGGGTGSAISELVRILKDLDLPLITLTTLPNEYESGIAKVNAVRAVSDLVKTEGVGWIFADNSRLAQAHGGVSLDKYFEKINEVIVGPIDAFNKLNNRQGIHPIRTLDGEDFRSLLLSGGVLHFASSTLPMLTVDMVMERVRESLQSSSVMPGGFSPEEVSYMGIVLEAGEDVLSGTPFSFFEQLNERLKDDTGGGAIYMGVYRRERPVEGGAALLRMICSTKSLPEGVQAVVNDARREGGTLRDKLQRSISSLELGDIEDFDLFKTSTRTNNPTANNRRRVAAPQLNVPDLNAKRPARGAGTQSRQPGAASSASESASEPDPEPAPAALRSVSVGPSAAARSVAPAVRTSTAPAITPAAPAVALRSSVVPQTAGSVAGSGISAVTPQPSSVAAKSAPSEAVSAAAPSGVTPSSVTPNSVTPNSVTPNSVTPNSVTPNSVTPAAAATPAPGSVAPVAGAAADVPSGVGVVGSTDSPSGETSAEAANSDAPASVRSASLSEAPEASPSQIPPGGPDDADRRSEAASYAKLVATFLRTEFESTKRRVARRLDAARQSDDAKTRAFAERAIERIRSEGQGAAFDAALSGEESADDKAAPSP